MIKTGCRFLSALLAACMLLAGGGSAFAQGTNARDAGASDVAGYIGGQPNYVYHAMGAAAADPLFSQQWGLYNDGSFRMGEKENPYPVYDDPFEIPWDSGQWEINKRVVFHWGEENKASGSGQPVGAQSGAAKAVTSVEGVDINVAEAWERFDTGGDEVIVAIIDTGVDYTNEQLADAIWFNEDEIPGDGIDNDGNGYIDDVYGWNFYQNNNKVYTGEEDNHGTHGAGTIAAKRDGEGIAGIAGSSNVKLMVLKALGGEDGSGTTESILEAIQYAEANGASICNLSLGTAGNDQTLRKAIEASDMLFVAAAGNGSGWTGAGQNTDYNPIYPAAWELDNLISVANIQPDGTLHSSSNYGAKTIDIAAPGSYILSTVTDGGYSYMTGTSMAAPMVTAVSAMLYSQYGDMTAAEAKSILLTSARELPGLKGKVRTGGMLDAGAALALDRSTAEDWSSGSGDGASPGQADPNAQSPQTGTPQTGNGGGPAGHGSAPVIRTSTMDYGMGRYLLVTVTDADNDLKAVRYMAGEKGAAWFNGGRNGTAFTLDGNGTGTFLYKKGGVYTFYAVDEQGNETIFTVRLSDGQWDPYDEFSRMIDRMFLWQSGFSMTLKE